MLAQARSSDDAEPEWRRKCPAACTSTARAGDAFNLTILSPALPFQEEPILNLRNDPRASATSSSALHAPAPNRARRDLHPAGTGLLEFSPNDRAHPQTALVPVAGLSDRRMAGLIDAIFLGLTLPGFMGLFLSLHGQITWEDRRVVYLVVGYLFYALYFFVFTTLAG